MIGQDNNGAYKMAWSQKFDGKLYAFPFRNGSSFTARVQGDGTVWDAKTAVSGIPMVLWDGNILTEAQTICNDGSNSGWYAGNPAYARAAVGVTAQGKVFAFCGQQVEGSVGVSMLDLAKVMKELGLRLRHVVRGLEFAEHAYQQTRNRTQLQGRFGRRREGDAVCIGLQVTECPAVRMTVAW